MPQGILDKREQPLQILEMKRPASDDMFNTPCNLSLWHVGVRLS